MAVKAAEEFITNCHRCNKDFVKSDVRIATPKRNEPSAYWYLCLDCFMEEGQAWWATCSIKNITEKV